MSSDPTAAPDSSALAPSADWAVALADQILAGAGGYQQGQQVTVASGISPSGPVHMGNMREIFTQHFVAEQLRRIGVPVRHILSWDDYDRFRRVPKGVEGVDESFAQHIGKPLSAVPDPCGQHESWAQHFKIGLQESMAALGIAVQEIHQTQMYTSGAYDQQILHAMRQRQAIDEVLARYRTKKPVAGKGKPAEGAGDSGGASEEEGGSGGGQYYPFIPYCRQCGTDNARVTAFDDQSTLTSYTCTCGFTLADVPLTQVEGKLAWKIDWPMRWAFEQVNFEPAGADHSSPGSSRTVGEQVVREIFGGHAPLYAAYSFVGIEGMAKMSSSAGNVPTPADALEVMEPAVLRWLYGRRRPNQSFTISFGPDLARLYDEWDAALARQQAGTSDELEQVQLQRATVSTTAGPLPMPERRVSFRTLASIVDITAGNPEQLHRLVADLTADDPQGQVSELDQVQPRLELAQTWMLTHVEPGERTQVRAEPNRALLERLEPGTREGLQMLADGLDAHWSLDGLTGLLYGIPKTQLGLPHDVKPTPELKKIQRAWFATLYQLLTMRETGPRLPTLLLALGREKVRALLTP